MAYEVKIPDLGEDIHDGEVLRVLVSAGDELVLDQPVLEFETGKATLEIPTEVAGRVQRILAEPGQRLEVGDVILLLDAAATSPAAASPTEAAKPEAVPPRDSKPIQTPPPPSAGRRSPSSRRRLGVQDSPPPSAGEGLGVGAKPHELRLPDLGEDIADGEVIRLLVQPGDTVDVDQPVLELETGKATVEVPSDAAGVVQEICVTEGERVAVGQALLLIGRKEAPSTPPATSPREGPPPSAAPPLRVAAMQQAAPAAYFAPPVARPRHGGPPHVPVRAAPSVRKFARELGIDIYDVPPRSPNARIILSDVKTFAKRRLSEREPAPAQVTPTLPDFAKWGDIDRQPMSRLRKAAAGHLSRAWSLVPHVTQHDLTDVTDLEAWRREYNEQIQSPEKKLTITILLVRVVSEALKEFPQFNASLDVANEEIVFKKYIHVGLAVDTPRGLVVPVIRNADRMSLNELSLETSNLADARGRASSPWKKCRGGHSRSPTSGESAAPISHPLSTTRKWPFSAWAGAVCSRCTRKGISYRDCLCPCRSRMIIA